MGELTKLNINQCAILYHIDNSSGLLSSGLLTVYGKFAREGVRAVPLTANTVQIRARVEKRPHLARLSYESNITNKNNLYNLRK